MHTSRKSFSALLLGATIICGGSTTWAQETPKQDAPKQDAPQQQRRGRGPLQRILTDLDLTAEQKAQIEPMVKEAQQQQRAAREDANLTPEQRRTKNREITQALRAKVEPLLNEEQKKKLGEIFAQNRRQGRRQRNQNQN
jgi:Spy/CpxP family protein refolding chaperone